MAYQNKPLANTALRFVLEALIPYSEANLQLVFKPNTFFNELEKRQDGRIYSRSALRKAYYLARQSDMVTLDPNGQPHVSALARQKLRPYEPHLLANSRLMVIFDIPEQQKRLRQQLRLLLCELKFVKIQQSVWASDYDSRDILTTEITRLKIQQYVEIYEAVLVST